MSELTMNNQKTLRFKIPVLLLAVAAWALLAFSAISAVVNIYALFYGDFENMFRLNFVGIIKEIIKSLPCILLALYALIFYKNNKMAIILPVTFFVIALSQLMVTTSMLTSAYAPGLYEIVSPLVAAAFVLAGISGLKGFSKKLFLIIAVALGAISVFAMAISILRFFTAMAGINNVGVVIAYVVLSLAELFGTIALYGGLFLLCLTNKAPQPAPATVE